MRKLNKLKSILKRMGSVLVAYSGGVDSTLLLKIAHDCLGKKALAVTACSETYPAEELSDAKKMAKVIGARHKIIRTSELKDKRFIANPKNRCYYCKLELFRKLKKIALDYKLNFVVDASNVSDKNDYRPGSIARKELGARSPLIEADFTKDDIRKLSKSLGLSSWNKPNLACLASRIPYGRKISPALLNRLNNGEKYLRSLGFKQVRLRHHDNICRLEASGSDLSKLLIKRKLIIDKLKKLGYNYITLDLEGYRTGSMNEAILK